MAGARGEIDIATGLCPTHGRREQAFIAVHMGRHELSARQFGGFGNFFKHVKPILALAQMDHNGASLTSQHRANTGLTGKRCHILRR